MRVDIKGPIVPNSDKWVYDFLGLEAVSPKDVQKVLDTAGGQPVDVYINSGGGEIFAGSEIYAALRNYGGHVRIHVVGLAASAASVILCAGRSDITPTGMVMVHNVTSREEGDYHAMDHKSGVLQEANKAMAAAYREKTGMSEEEALAMMDEETWLTAEKAVACGLIDRIAEPAMQLVAAYGSPMLSRSVIEAVREKLKLQEETPKMDQLEKVRAELALLHLGGIK